MANLKELSEEIAKLKSSIQNIDNPSAEYKVNLEQALEEVKTRIVLLNSTVEIAKNEILELKNKVISSIREIDNELKVITEPESIRKIPVFDLIPSFTTIKLLFDEQADVIEHHVFITNTNTQQTTSIETSNIGLTIPGLLQDTKYSIYIKVVYDDYVVSPSTEPVQIKTLKIN